MNFNKTNQKNIILIVVFLIILLVGFIFFIFFFKTSFQNNQDKIGPTKITKINALLHTLLNSSLNSTTNDTVNPIIPHVDNPNEIYSDKNITIYFCQIDNCTKATLNFMESAQTYLYCAFYDLDLPELISKLDEKSKTMDVKLYMDNDYYILRNYSKHDSKGPLMHNKFCVADNNKIFTGSFNPTLNDAYKNDNNLEIIDSSLLAKNYKDQFLELYNNTKVQQPVTYPIIIMNTSNGLIKIENYFCPEDNCAKHISDVIYSANKSVYFMTFSFTNQQIANAVVAKSNGGLEVKGIFEKRNINNYSMYSFFQLQEVDVKVDNNKYNMHHKVFIIDNEIVVTGSMNPTQGGDNKNDENILIIHNKKLAMQFLKEFERVWNN